MDGLTIAYSNGMHSLFQSNIRLGGVGEERDRLPIPSCKSLHKLTAAAIELGGKGVE